MNFISTAFEMELYPKSETNPANQVSPQHPAALLDKHHQESRDDPRRRETPPHRLDFVSYLPNIHGLMFP